MIFWKLFSWTIVSFPSLIAKVVRIGGGVVVDGVVVDVVGVVGVVGVVDVVDAVKAEMFIVIT